MAGAAARPLSGTRGIALMELDGRVALVTGGARRLGRAFVEATGGKGHASRCPLRRFGWRSRSHWFAELAARGHEAESFGADLRDADAAGALPDRVVERFGQLDVLINSAAVMERVSVAEATVQHWNDVINLNLRAPFFVAQHAASAPCAGARHHRQHRRSRRPRAVAKLRRAFDQQGRRDHADQGAGHRAGARRHASTPSRPGRYWFRTNSTPRSAAFSRRRPRSSDSARRRMPSTQCSIWWSTAIS